MTFIGTASLSSVFVAYPLDQTQNQIMDGSQDTTGSADRHAGSIFMESDIPAVMQAGFDQPVLASHLKHFGW